jgi:hypothetical protein
MMMGVLWTMRALLRIDALARWELLMLIYGSRQADLLVILSRRQHTILSAMLSQIHNRGSCSIWWAI